jgi:hypothetical protein
MHAGMFPQVLKGLDFSKARNVRLRFASGSQTMSHEKEL